jgi:hypothetical protein
MLNLSYLTAKAGERAQIAVAARARRWRPQVNGRKKTNNKRKLLGSAEFTRRPRAKKRSTLEQGASIGWIASGQPAVTPSARPATWCHLG